MRTEKDIQIELLQEINDICSLNSLNYILIGSGGLNAFLNHTIKNGPFSVAIAMPSGDIGRFCDIINSQYSKERYVERINPESDSKCYVNYGNKNTTNFYIFNAYNKVHNGININIYPIRGLDKKIIEADDSKTKNQNLFSKILNRISGKSDENKSNESVKADLKDDSFIDRWDDIDKFSSIKIINSKIDSILISEIEGYEVDGTELSLPKDPSKFFRKIFGKNYRNREIKPAKLGPRYIINTEVGYEQIISQSKDLIDEAISLHEEVQLESAKVDEDRKSIKDLSDLVLMTNKEIEFTKYFDENLDSLLSYDLSDKKQLNEVYKELKPVISSLKKYSKLGMTFNISPQADSLIENVLLAKSDEKLVNKMKELNEKQYFVE